jgi:transcriptional regulator with XRE-family HTH domain
MRDWPRLVGANIRRFRVAKGLSQERLAFAANIDLTYMGGIERGKRNPSLLVMIGIADALGCAPVDLFAKTIKPSAGQRRTGPKQSNPEREV